MFYLEGCMLMSMKSFKNIYAFDMTVFCKVIEIMQNNTCIRILIIISFRNKIN